MHLWKLVICLLKGHTPARPFPIERPYEEVKDILGATVVIKEICKRCGLVYWHPGPKAWVDLRTHRGAVIDAAMSDAVLPLIPHQGEPN